MLSAPYVIILATRFKRDLKRVSKQGKDIDMLENIINVLANNKKLPTKNKDHALIGNYDGCRECHIEPDWLLIYKTDQQTKTLKLIRTGSHTELFKN